MSGTVSVNLLALESVLISRLAEQLADLSPKVKVLAAADLAGVSEEQQTTPAVHVIYRGLRVIESRHDALAARTEQTWLAVVATRNAKSLRTGDAARNDAGLIASRVLQALMGYKPPGLAKPLRLADAQEAGFNAGFTYLPLAFVAEVAITHT